MKATEADATSSSSDLSAACGAQAQLLPDGRIVDVRTSGSGGSGAGAGASAASSLATQCAICAAAIEDRSISSRALRHLIGELQFAFASFLCGQSYAAFEQWKHLVDIICRSEEAQVAVCGRSRPSADASKAELPAQLYPAALAALREQLPHLPRDFFVDELSRRNFLGVSLAALVRTAAVKVGQLQPRFVHDVAQLCDAAAAAFPGWFVPGVSRLAVAMVAEGLSGAPRSAEDEEAAADAATSAVGAAGASADGSKGGSGDVGASAATHASHASAAASSSSASGTSFATADLLAALEAVAAADGRSVKGNSAAAPHAPPRAAERATGPATDTAGLAAARSAALAAIDALPTVSDYDSMRGGGSAIAATVGLAPPATATGGGAGRAMKPPSQGGPPTKAAGWRLLSCAEELDVDGEGDDADGHDDDAKQTGSAAGRHGAAPAASGKATATATGAAVGSGKAQPAAASSFADVSHLLAALRDEGGDDDLPAFVPVTDLGEFAAALTGAGDGPVAAATAVAAPQAAPVAIAASPRTRAARLVVVDDDE